jgi:bifunctional DNase/RNase
MTHDLLKHVLLGLGGELRRVTITNVRDNTYFAELLIRREDQAVQVDARPSDSIALALRLGAPIFTSDDLLNHPGGESGPPAPERRLDAESLKQYLEKLDPQDFGRFTP